MPLPVGTTGAGGGGATVVGGTGAVVKGAVVGSSAVVVDTELASVAGDGDAIDSRGLRVRIVLVSVDDDFGRSDTTRPTAMTAVARTRIVFGRALSTVLCDESCEAVRRPRREVRRDPVSLPAPTTDARCGGV